MITEQEFIEAINKLSDEYEAIKDTIYMNMHVIDPKTQELLGKLAQFRDTACTALRASHVTQNFKSN